MPYHPEIEFCLKLQRILVHDPRKGRTFSQWLSFIVFDILQIVVPVLTLISLMRANHVTVTSLIKIILNFTLFGHMIFRQATLFLNQRNLVYLLETTKKFWPMENYEEETKKLKRNSNIYLCLASFFVTAANAKRHLRANMSGLYIPQWIPRQAMFTIADICQMIGSISFVSYDIMAKTFIVLVTKDMELLNRKLLKCYDHQVYGDGRSFKLQLKECVDRYNLLREFCTKMNDMYAKCMLVTIFSSTFSCTVCLYMILETIDPRILMDGIMHMATALYFMVTFYCVPGQKLFDQVELLSLNAYLSNWQHQPKENKNMLIVLTKTQVEFGIKAGGFIPLNMQTFVAVCRAIISYCMFFRTIDGTHN